MILNVFQLPANGLVIFSEHHLVLFYFYIIFYIALYLKSTCKRFGDLQRTPPPSARSERLHQSPWRTPPCTGGCPPYSGSPQRTLIIPSGCPPGSAETRICNYTKHQWVNQGNLLCLSTKFSRHVSVIIYSLKC